MRIAAIDIGSNAARLLINDVSLYTDGSPEFTKTNLLRIPLRLGFEVFENGYISAEKEYEIIEMMKAFKHILNVYKVQHVKAVATSAMRDAKNGDEICKHVLEQTQIPIEIISGSAEATILFETYFSDTLDGKKVYLYIDVGGGSTELTLFQKNHILFKESFNVGTIRLLTDKVLEAEWARMKQFVKSFAKNYNNIIAIGSGGNINKVFSLSKSKPGKNLSLDYLKNFHKELSAMSLAERIHQFKLKEDRADVIVPALLVYTSIMRWANINDIAVPQIGLADGLIKRQYIEQSFTAMKGLKTNAV